MVDADTVAYERRKRQARERNARLSASGRDIAPLPEIVDPARRARARRDFSYFCEQYFPSTFYLPWSSDHGTVIAKIERAVTEGGLFALAMPRGGGKTTLCERACIWAVLYGHRRYVCLIGSDEGLAVSLLDTIRTELEGNERLAEDFPAAVYPVRSLEGIANRCSGQIYNSERTHIAWKQKKVVMATIRPEEDCWQQPEHAQCLRPDGRSRASGAIITVAGITGRVRGPKHHTASGESVRPDLVILDDPQTDESAASLLQCRTRERILAGAVLGLAGPDRKIAGVMPCTVISPDDMADRILDREKHPQWQGERLKMIYQFPGNEKLWEEYEAILKSDPDDFPRCEERATEFYRQRREEMDAGAEVAWPARYEGGEISGIQHAMNKKLLKPRVFWAEYQNTPETGMDAGLDLMLDVDDLAGKTNGRKRGLVPTSVQEITAFVDVNEKLLYWAVCGWEPDFTGYVLDYGTYPEQRQRDFQMRDAHRTIRRVHQGVGLEGALYAAMETCVGGLMGREWRRDDGMVMSVGLMLIDQGWQTDLVHQFCRQAGHGASLMPARGRSIRASNIPVAEYDRSRGQIGYHWYIPAPSGKRVLRHVETDNNFWKTFIHERLGVAMGDRGCLSLYGHKSSEHRLFAEHLLAEVPVETEGRGRTLLEWNTTPARPDNHWLDCMVGCAAAASMRGVATIASGGTEVAKTQDKKQKIRLSDLQRRKRRERSIH